MVRAPRLLPRLLAALGGGAAALVGTELALRVLGPEEAYRIWPPGLEQRFLPSPEVLPGVEGPSLFRIDARGFRAGPLPGPAGSGPRVLALGGSTTECLYLDQEEAWPRLLERRLREGGAGSAWVANAGVSGRSTREHVVQLPRLLAQEPRFDVVLCLVGVNDLALVLARGEDYDPSFLEREDAEAELLPRAFAVLPRAESRLPFPRSTALYRLASDLLRRRTADAVQDAFAERYRLWRRHRAESPRRLETLPDLEPALGEFRRNLSRMAEACRAAGARFCVATPPALWTPEPSPELEARLWMGWVGASQDEAGLPYYATPALARGLELYREALRALAREAGWPLVELADLDGDPALFYDDVHLSEAGARRVAERIAEDLRDELLPAGHDGRDG